MTMLWQPPPSYPTLNPNEVHLWCMNLEIPEDVVNNFAITLSEDEISKVNRFRFDYLRRRYIGARGMLRLLLGQYLSIEPSQINFRYSEKGKPYLHLPDYCADFSFNLSHSEEIAVFALSNGGDVGVDVEKIQPTRDVKAIAQRFFCPSERELIAGLKGEEQLTTFFQLWTAKEAYLKATGDGIGGGLDSIEVHYHQGQIKRLSPNDTSVALPDSNNFTPFTLADNYVGAAVKLGEKSKFLGFIADEL